MMRVTHRRCNTHANTDSAGKYSSSGSSAVNWIKILATERAGLPATDPRRQTLSEEEMRTIVDEARRAGLPVAAHAHGDDGAAAAVRAGVRSIEHGSRLSDSTLDLMKRRDTYLVPTIALGDMLTRAPSPPNAGPEFQKRTVELSESAHATTIRAWKKGIPLVTGTDQPQQNFRRFHCFDEVAEFVKIGIAPIDAIKAATPRSGMPWYFDSNGINPTGVRSRSDRG